MNKKLQVYYFSGTHWDREWYQSFQGFRYKLVKMINELIDYMESEPGFEVFHFDGQTIVLEDYLEIEPVKRARLEILIRSNRIKIGPWYCMPDEFLLSGESLISNLQLGHKISSQFGSKAWDLGYICDIFGHIAQMPQIFNGFNITSSLLARGINEGDSSAFFLWKSPDESECITFNVPENGGYGAFSSRVLGYDDAGPVIVADYVSRIKEYFDSEMKRSSLPFIVAMDAHDHQSVHKETVKIIKTIRDSFPDMEVHHANLSDLFKTISSEYKERLQTIYGELNKTLRANETMVLISNTLSSRYPLKKDNDICQTLMEKWTLPLHLISSLNGNQIQHTYLEIATKHLLQNHPHDSICGCSIDQVHKDMEYRFDQVKMISNEVINDSLSNEYKNIVKSNVHEKLLCVFNPLPYDREELIFVEIAFDKNYPTTFTNGFGYQFINSFLILDDKNNEIPYQICEIKKDYTVRTQNQITIKADVYKIGFNAKLSAMGTTGFKIVPQKGNVRYFNNSKLNINEAENEFIKLSINSDGSINIKDNRNGREYKNLLTFVDDGEIGDGWYHCNSIQDSCFVSKNDAMIERIICGPSFTRFKITKFITIPKNMEYGNPQIKRSDEFVQMKIESQITLSSAENFIRVETTIDNTARDHRLRMFFPTGITSDKYFANQAFCFNERDTGIDISTATWKEPEVHEKQMASIVGKRNSKGDGIAIASDYGLHECAAFNDNDGNIAITMFRAFTKTVLTNGEDGGEILGKHQFSFSLIPFTNETSFAKLQKTNDCLSTGVNATVFNTNLNGEVELIVVDNMNSDVNNSVSSFNENKSSIENFHNLIGSYIKIDSDSVCYSTLKVPESGEENCAILRVFNCSDENATAKIRLFRNIKSSCFTNLLEESIMNILPQSEAANAIKSANSSDFTEMSGKICDSKNQIEFDLPKWKIATIKICFE